METLRSLLHDVRGDPREGLFVVIENEGVMIEWRGKKRGETAEQICKPLREKTQKTNTERAQGAKAEQKQSTNKTVQGKHHLTFKTT